MGCTVPRNEKLNALKQDFESINELQENVNNAIIAIYSKDSPIIVSPIIKSKRNQTIYFKMENLQLSGSFKLRGVYYKIQKLYSNCVEKFKKNNLQIIAASTGNHVLACQYVTRLIAENLKNKQENVLPIEDVFFPVELTIMVPETTPPKLLDALKRHEQSQIIIGGKDTIECDKNARELANQKLQHYISAYDLDIIAGAATIGKEIEEWILVKKIQVDYLFVSVSGGGLISGVSFYLKYMQHLKIQVIGVQSEGNALFDEKNLIINDLKKEKPFSEMKQTILLCKHLVDDWVVVKEDEVEKALWEITQSEKVIVERAAALAYAGCLKYYSEQNIAQEKVNSLILIGGQNIEMEEVQALMQKFKDQNEK